MISVHPSFAMPADQNLSLWRYMDLSKFVWMLQRQALYFSRLDALGDPFEGHYTRSMLSQEDAFVDQWESITRANSKEQDKNSAFRQKLRDGFRMMLRTTQDDKLNHYLSCLQCFKKESDAMWRLYTTHGESICIRTTFKTLAEELPSICMMGCVNYIDYDKSSIDMGNGFNYVMHKRDSFQHEQEIRAVIWMPFAKNTTPPVITSDGKGAIIPIDLEKTIEDVLVSPTSNPTLLEIVQSLCKTYGLNNTVRQSTVRSPPNY